MLLFLYATLSSRVQQLDNPGGHLPLEHLRKVRMSPRGGGVAKTWHLRCRHRALLLCRLYINILRLRSIDPHAHEGVKCSFLDLEGRS